MAELGALIESGAANEMLKAAATARGDAVPAPRQVKDPSGRGHHDEAPKKTAGELRSGRTDRPGRAIASALGRAGEEEERERRTPHRHGTCSGRAEGDAIADAIKAGAEE